LFNIGILYYVIIISSIIMMLGLMFTKTKFSEAQGLVLGENDIDGPLGLS